LKVLYGNSRIVLLTKSHAVKFARIRPLKALIWFIGFLSGKIKLSRDQKDKSLLRILGGITLCGVMANLREYTYSVEYPHDNRIKPASKCLLNGIVILQPRGEGATKKDIPRGSFRLFPYIIPRTETCLSKQYAIFHDEGVRRVLLIDFGSKITVEALKTTCYQKF